MVGPFIAHQLEIESVFMITSLKPTKRELVYDLIREAGIDVSDWSNYERPQLPQSNPRYCYDWSFVELNRVVVCLWFDDMQEHDNGIFQELNYGNKPEVERGLSGVQKNRCWSMDAAFRKAYRAQLPVRVIIVDGPTDRFDERAVARRSLDSVEWHIAAYDENSYDTLLRRGTRRVIPESGSSFPSPAPATNGDTINDLYDPELLGRDSAVKNLQLVPGVARDPKVRRAVLIDCNYTCERPGCGAKRDFSGFIDVHHIFGVLNSDRPWTCVALCPNCHREAHFSPDSERLNREFLAIAEKRRLPS
jgi:hypothetical protein